MAGIRLTVPAFFALQDTRTPVVVAFFAFVLNAVLGYLLGFVLSLDHFGLALASSISSALNFFALLYLLDGRLGRFLSRDVLWFFLKILAVSVLMGFLVVGVAGFSPWNETGLSLSKGLWMAAAVVSGAVFYFAVCRVLGVGETRVFFPRGGK